MSYEMIFVFGVLLLAVVLFVTEKISVDLVALLIMAILLVSQILSPAEGLAGFSNTATITVASMFIISAGLFKTGAVNFLGVFVNRIFKQNFWVAMIAVMILVGVLSAFINNTPVIAIFLPIILGVAKETKISASKLLMPISFASMLGGVCTLIGTSTNILVSSIAEEKGLPAFTMFEFLPLGLAMFVVGTAYMLIIGIRLIPERRGEGDLTETFSLGEYLTEVVLQDHSSSVGCKIKDAPICKDLDFLILEIRRGEELLNLPTAEVVLHAGDNLKIRADVEKIRALQKREGVKLKPQSKWGDESVTSEDYKLVEAVVAPHATFDGESLQEINFREKYGTTVLAIRQHGKLLREKISDTKLRGGDTLLIEANKDRIASLKLDNDFIIVSETETVKFRRDKVVIAILIVVGVILSASLGFLPIVVSSVVGAILLVLFRCLLLDEVYQAIDWKIIFLLAGVLSLGTALEKTGAAEMVSLTILSSVGSFGPVLLVSGFYLLTSISTEMISNNASAALIAPIAIATAATLEVSPIPFLVAVTFAASASFMTPVGYQTNTMIYGPGQYKFFDFVKVGTPLNIILWITASLLIPVFWKF
ncbi:MAG: SLC13 family permease [Acidobacteriota bacterium]|jgi:di/tricarboxylate transporter|nr:SLC13 family permease [Acidobacteriota bacterium]